MNKLLMALPLVGLILAGCESPHKFDVSPDEIIIKGSFSNEDE